MKRDTLLILDSGFQTARWLGQLFPKVERYNRLAQIGPNCVLAFEGGVDISPRLYGQRSGFHTQDASYQRDDIERHAMMKAIKVKAGIVGICRGAQLACAMSGGTLIQHVTGHHGNHWIRTKDNHNFLVTSSHHQMMNPFDLPDADYELLGWTSNGTGKTWAASSMYLGEDDETVMIPEKEPEVVFFRKTQAIAIQGHPEWAKHDGVMQTYCRDIIKKHLLT